MIVAIGSKNEAKVCALKTVASTFQFAVYAQKVASRVANQPLSDEETMRGAKNRAREILAVTNADVGVGLEGGITKIGQQWFICNWGALVDRSGCEFVSCGGHVMLPKSIFHELEQGKELRDVFSSHQREGAIARLTNGYVTRQAVYEQVLYMLFGQYFMKKSTEKNASD